MEMKSSLPPEFYPSDPPRLIVCNVHDRLMTVVFVVLHQHAAPLAVPVVNSNPTVSIRSRLLQRTCSSDQASLSRAMVEAECPPASLPSNAPSASSKSAGQPRFVGGIPLLVGTTAPAGRGCGVAAVAPVGLRWQGSGAPGYSTTSSARPSSGREPWRSL
jgi:hypothetical protein